MEPISAIEKGPRPFIDFGVDSQTSEDEPEDTRWTPLGLSLSLSLFISRLGFVRAIRAIKGCNIDSGVDSQSIFHYINVCYMGALCISSYEYMNTHNTLIPLSLTHILTLSLFLGVYNMLDSIDNTEAIQYATELTKKRVNTRIILSLSLSLSRARAFSPSLHISISISLYASNSNIVILNSI